MTERAPSPPAALEAAMRRALDDNPSPTAVELLDAAERLLDKVLGADCESRASALDLLTVDALVTQALEVAAKDPNDEDFPVHAIQRIASHYRDDRDSPRPG